MCNILSIGSTIELCTAMLNYLGGQAVEGEDKIYKWPSCLASFFSLLLYAASKTFFHKTLHPETHRLPYERDTMAALKTYCYPEMGEWALKAMSYVQAIRVENRIVCSGQGKLKVIFFHPPHLASPRLADAQP